MRYSLLYWFNNADFGCCRDIMLNIADSNTISNDDIGSNVLNLGYGAIYLSMLLDKLSHS